MALSREQALHIRNFLDNWLPPVLRDSRLVMYPLLLLAFGKRFPVFADFKTRGFAMSAAEFSHVYSSTTDLQQVQGCTDLNDACVGAILKEVMGTSVLDVGCGRGHLVDQLTAVSTEVVGCDIVVDEALVDREGLRFVQGSVEQLPFADGAFDTVVTTHTLEHVQRIDRALCELRRVARRRLIVVVPKERPYRYSFNLHLHFFPYPWNWQAVAGHRAGSRLIDLDDWFYVEDLD
jgi:ubiquinone/menaquinone biosynthesis C-methylase UbiE